MEQQQLFKVRDLRKKDQYKMDDKYLNGYARIFGPITTAVYNSLSRHAEFHTQEAFPSEELIAEEHGIGVKSVQRSIKKLVGANIIKIERIKRQGRWLNNNYFLIDKSEWKQPEDIKTLWRTKRHYSRKPEDIKAQTIGHQDPIKDTHSKDTNIKDTNNTAIQRIAGKEINDLIELFKSINPSYERLFRNISQRAAIERMVKKHSLEKIEWAIKVLDKTNKMPFSPTITTPIQLEMKLGDLIAFIQKSKLKAEAKKPTIAKIK